MRNRTGQMNRNDATTWAIRRIHLSLGLRESRAGSSAADDAVEPEPAADSHCLI